MRKLIAIGMALCIFITFVSSASAWLPAPTPTTYKSTLSQSQVDQSALAKTNFWGQPTYSQIASASGSVSADATAVGLPIEDVVGTKITSSNGQTAYSSPTFVSAASSQNTNGLSVGTISAGSSSLQQAGVQASAGCGVGGPCEAN